MPLKHEREVIGSLNVVSKTVEKINSNDKLAIESIAAKMGSVISYIKAQEQIVEHKQELEQKVKERTQKLEKLNAKLSQEITYHKRTREALNFSENLYRSIFNNAQDGIILYELKTRKIVDFNHKTNINLGYSREEFKNLGPLDFLVFNSKDEQDEMYERIVKNQVLISNIRTKTKTGEIKYNVLTTSVIKVKKVEYILAVLHDVTELKEATLELVKSEKKIRELQESVSIGMFRLNHHSDLVYLNPFAHKLLKVKKSIHFANLKFEDFGIAKNDFRKYARRLIKKKSVRNIKTHIRRLDGSSFYANINLNLTFNDTGVTSIDGTLEDISAVMRAQEELKKANRQIIRINKSLEERIKSALEKQKRNQTYIVQKSKLESLGELAAGIAHEVNQPLGVLSLAFENLQSRIINGETDFAYLLQKFTSIDENIQRIRNIIEQVKTFSRDEPPLMMQKVYINNCIHNVLKLVGQQYRNHGIKLELNLNEEIGFTVGSRTRLEQVIMNLLSNSKYAVDEFADYFNSSDYQKQITISTGFKDKNQVYLSVEDNGIGIEKAKLENVFDPFYTTKPSWKGTGLGLSIVYGILNEMRAEITVKSELEKFTRFTIVFPMYPEKY